MICDVEFGAIDGRHGPRGNHQEDGAVKIAEAALKLAQVAALLPDLHIELRDSFDFYPETGPIQPVKWFSDHAGHDIQARNEYGMTYTQYQAHQEEIHASMLAEVEARKLVPK